jgi:ATP-binding cassette subfamily F protein uup
LIALHLLSVENVSKAYADKTLFEDVTFGVSEGDKIGVIGVNGTGKSTLLKVMAGREPADSGAVTTGSRVRIRMLDQDPEFRPGETALAHVLAAAGTKDGDEDYWTLETEAKTALSRLGIQDFDVVTDTLSGGQRKRVAMAAALLQPSELLILDEPTNHIDNESVAWLEGFLRKRRGALIMITHDRYFLDRVSNRILELDRGRAYFYEANYSRFLELKLDREERESASEDKRRNLLRNELVWIRRGAQARSTKQKARIDRFETLRGQTPKTAGGKLDVSVSSTRLGKKILELDSVSKRFGDRPLIRDLSYIAVPKDRVGIIGANGSGKSTLLKLIAGSLKPDEGTVDLGPTVKLGWFTQEHEEMDESLRVIEFIREGAEQVRTADGSMLSAGQMLERFLFPPETQWTQIARLSGGEKRRLQLLKVLMEAPNVLLLDEPTNDLDIATLTVLEDYLDSFPGVVFTVSHDRYFLDRTVERIFAFEGDGRVVQHTGNYSEYREYADKHFAAKPVSEPSGSKNAAGNASGAAAPGTESRDKQLRMSYKDQKDFEQIDGWIAETEDKLNRVTGQMEAASSDSMRLQELMTEQQELTAKLDGLLERWTELNEQAEQIAAQKKS